MTSCPCGEVAVRRCAQCKRALCVWHGALRPVESTTGVRLQDECHPPCYSEHWDELEKAAEKQTKGGV